jgi:glycosyltransferase involved in cell wall biosynthesis
MTKSTMKVALIGLFVSSGNGDNISELVDALSEHLEVKLFVPERYNKSTGSGEFYKFKTGTNKIGVLLKLLNPFAAWIVWKKIRDFNPDIIYFYNGEGAPWTIFWEIAAKIAKIPVLLAIHDPEIHPGDWFTRLIEPSRQLSFKLAYGIHVYTEIFVDYLSERGYDRNKIFVFPHGSIANQFTIYKDETIVKEKMALLFGRLEAYKGIDTFIKAGLILQGRIKFCIAGAGEIPVELQQIIEENPRIFEFQNRFIPNQEVTHLFQRSSVFVLPYNQVTQSLFPLISAGLGVPVVASDLGSFKTEIPKVNGVLVPPNDPESLAAAIEDSLDRIPSYPQEMEYQNLVVRIESVYQQVIDSFHDSIT